MSQMCNLSGKLVNWNSWLQTPYKLSNAKILANVSSDVYSSVLCNKIMGDFNFFLWVYWFQLFLKAMYHYSGIKQTL